jgi:hypothetical protein
LIIISATSRIKPAKANQVCYADGMSRRLFLRPTGRSSPAYREWLDYVVIEGGQIIGRMYEDPHAPAEVRWFWSITEYVDPRLCIDTNGRVPSLDEAKARFRLSWSRVSEASKHKEQQP